MRNKAFLLGLLSIGFLATSCSSDDNEGETIIPLQGTYNLSKTGFVVGGSEVLNDATQNQAGCNRDYLDLRLSNTAVIGDYGANCTLTETTGTYVRSHNDLTITVGNVSTTSDIMNLTNKELKIKNKTTGEITVYTR